MRTTSRLLAALLAWGAGAVPARPTEAPRPGRPEASPPWRTEPVAAPRVTHHVFASAAAGAEVSYHLYTPEAHDREPATRFPVVYWLHGSGGGLSGIRPLTARFDAAIAAGRLPPCFVVLVNGLAGGMYVDWKDGAVKVESVIIRDLIPHIDATHRTIAARHGRVLEGFSMGGYGAARLGFSHPHLFAGVSLLGAGPLQPDFSRTPRAGPRAREAIFHQVYGGDAAYFLEVSPWAIAGRQAGALGGLAIRQAVGERDETRENNRAFHERMGSLGIPHAWTVVPGVGHDPIGLIAALGDDFWAFHRAVFRPPDSPGPAVPERSVGGAGAFDGELRVRVGAGERRARVYVPAGDRLRPALLVLHGGAGSPERTRAQTGFDALARREGVLLAFPEGTAFGEGRHAWNTGFLRRRQVRDADDVAFLDALIDRLIAAHGADPARIYLTGGSNGGMMTFRYAVERAGRLAAAAPVVATMASFDRRPDVPVPLLIINGARDDEVPLEGGFSRHPLVRAAQTVPFQPVREVVDFWVRANRSHPTPVLRTEGTVTTATHPALPGGAVTEFVLDAAGGHGWPGGRALREGNTPITAFDGAERVWAFLRQHTRRPAPPPP